MNNNEHKYDNLIGRLRSYEPELHDSERSVSALLEAIRQPAPKAATGLRVISLGFSVAAVLLLVLFLSELSLTPPAVSTPPARHISIQPALTDGDAEQIIRQKKERIERRAALIDKYGKL